MYQRFALIWPAMCLVSMGAHVFVAQDVPSLLGMIVTAVLAAPLAAIAARFDSRILTASLMLAIQVIAHLSLSLPVVRGGMPLIPRLSEHAEHVHGAAHPSGASLAAESLTHVMAGSGHMIVGHSGTSLPMLLGHLIAASVLTLAVSRVDGFINQLARFFGVLLGIAKPAPVTPAAPVQHLHQVFCVVAQWLRGCISLRGPPLSFSL